MNRQRFSPKLYIGILSFVKVGPQIKTYSTHDISYNFDCHADFFNPTIHLAFKNVHFSTKGYIELCTRFCQNQSKNKKYKPTCCA